MIPTSLTPGSTVSAQDRSDVIDLLNRLNLAFDIWDLNTMLGLHTDDFTVHHPRGVATGHDQLMAFYEDYYPLTVGVRRQHLNHVVTGNDDGTITVLSYNLLIRVATPERAAALKGQSVIEAEPGLPAIAMHSVMIDRFRRDPALELAKIGADAPIRSLLGRASVVCHSDATCLCLARSGENAATPSHKSPW